MHLNAQSSATTKPPARQTTYLLPDGRTLLPGKWDSLEQAWGKGRIMFQHTEEDDAKGIIHLVRQTDEIKQQQDEQKEKGLHVHDSMLNKPAPVFELTDMQGKRWKLVELRGKIVVLNFWFTNCGPCIREMPELNKLVQEYNQGDVVFLALTFDNATQVKAFLKTHSFNYMLLPASRAVDELYKISLWPTSMVICKKGNLKKVILSSTKIREELSVAINALR